MNIDLKIIENKMYINLMNIIANIIRLIHYLLMVFIFTGHILLPIEYIKYYLLLIVFIFLDWNDLDGQCILTRLEYYFETGHWEQKSPIEGGPEFFRPLVNKIFNLKLNRVEADRLNNFIFILCWLSGFIRIFSRIN